MATAHTAVSPAHNHPHTGLLRAVGGFISFIKKNVVFTVAVLAAAVTSFIVKPDARYLEYFDFKTLTCLFCVLATVCALRNIRFFTAAARRIVALFGNARSGIIAIVYITFIGSMLIANDMALLTFLPLGYFVLSGTGKEKYMAFLFIMQNIAANLGGMLTPFGNPQNLYLYTKFNIPTGEFMSIMLPPFLISIALITICCIFVRPEPIAIHGEPIKLPAGKTAVYLVLFALSIVIVFRVIPYWIGLVAVPAVLLFFDRKALRDVDYPLLLTFAAFFVFAGNMSRIGAVRDFFSSLLSSNTLVFSALSCQCISNVPSTILLSQFTQNYPALLVGVNIGGCGTLISSLASLITFREYQTRCPQKTAAYFGMFSAFNFGFLIILTLCMYFIMK